MSYEDPKTNSEISYQSADHVTYDQDRHTFLTGTVVAERTTDLAVIKFSSQKQLSCTAQLNEST